MKYLFLDIDGVLNTLQGDYYHMINGSHIELHVKTDKDVEEFRNPDGSIAGRTWDIRMSRGFCPVAVTMLKVLLRAVPDLKIVVSSTWRMGWNRDTIKTLFHFYPEIAERAIDVTPSMNTIRGLEIEKWLSQNAIGGCEYIILDDDGDFTDEQKASKLVQTDSYIGFGYHDLRKAVRLLGMDDAVLSHVFHREAEKAHKKDELTKISDALGIRIEVGNEY